jgi:methyltransferase (TIGR00027 family)
VLLGAGLDTRAYRLELPARLTVYELDLPEVLAFKESALRTADARPVCARHVVAVDLRTEWSGALLAAGFDPGLPTVWLAEGLAFYLDAASVDRLLTLAAELCDVRAVMALDLFGTGLLRLPSLRPTIQRRAAAGRSAPFCTDKPTALLHGCGWQHCAITEPGQSGANYGRLRPVPDDWSGGADPGMRTYLVVATRSAPL